MLPRLLLAVMLCLGLPHAAAHAQSATDAQSLGAMSGQALLQLPAKKVFGGMKLPAAGVKPRAIGFYAKGCLAGAQQLPITGPSWQVMRLSRNRNWGHPALIKVIEKLANDAKEKDGWNGLLVGDIAQPRGGPMATGHASHQVGLDADIWLTPMPNRILSDQEREDIQARLVVKDRKTMDYSVWTEAHARLLKRAASYPEVARIFVHPPIKAELCKWANSQPGDHSWLAKIRPYFGHNYHFHMRINCPADSPTCKNQPPATPADGTGCGDELAYWMGDKPWPQPLPPNVKPPKPVPPLTLAALPAECRAVVTAE